MFDDPTFIAAAVLGGSRSLYHAFQEREDLTEKVVGAVLDAGFILGQWYLVDYAYDAQNEDVGIVASVSPITFLSGRQAFDYWNSPKSAFNVDLATNLSLLALSYTYIIPNLSKTPRKH